MKYNHCEWCNTAAPEHDSEGWVTIPTLENDGLMYTYCPKCGKILNTVLGNRPEYVQKLVKLSTCTDDLFKILEEWIANRDNRSPTNIRLLDPDTELALAYKSVRKKYLEMIGLPEWGDGE